MKPYLKSFFMAAIGFFSALIVWQGVQNYLEVQRFPDLPSVQQSVGQSRPQLLDRQGRALEEIPSLEGDPIYWAPLAKISPEFVEAVVRALDPTFFRHKGIDFPGLLDGRKTTISSEAARLIRRREGESLPKLFLGALLLEREWSKDEILEAYLNLASFGPKLRGVEAAARMLLGKELAQLNAFDSAILAGVLRFRKEPNRANGENIARIACQIFAESHPESTPLVQKEACVEMGKISQNLGETPLLRDSKLGLAPELARRILQSPARNGERTSLGPVRTPVDREAQTRALALLNQAEEGALLVVENRTGEAWVYASRATENKNLLTRRLPVGQTFLPFLVAMGLEERVIQWRPLEIRDSLRDPRVMDSLFFRLGGSLALERKFIQVGLPSFSGASSTWPSSFGLRPWMEIDTSLEELTRAYLILARQGAASELRIASGEEVSSFDRALFSPGVALQIANGMVEGMGPYWQAQFTSAAGGDWVWSMGFTTRFTIGALAKNSLQAEKLRLGISDFLHADELKLAMKRPAPTPALPVKAVEKTNIDALSLKAAATIRPQPKVETKASTHILGRIRNPRDGASIPLGFRNPIRFRMEPYDGRLVWVLNGKTLGTAKSVGAWRPSAGDWRLTLRDSTGKLIDEVLFEVR